MNPHLDDVYQISAPHFCAGVVVNKASRNVSQAAPILAWTVNKRWTDVLAYFHRKKYHVQCTAASDAPASLIWPGHRS
jgi:hypothetical protein